MMSLIHDAANASVTQNALNASQDIIYVLDFQWRLKKVALFLPMRTWCSIFDLMVAPIIRGLKFIRGGSSEVGLEKPMIDREEHWHMLRFLLD